MSACPSGLACRAGGGKDGAGGVSAGGAVLNQRLNPRLLFWHLFLPSVAPSVPVHYYWTHSLCSPFHRLGSRGLPRPLILDRKTPGKDVSARRCFRPGHQCVKGALQDNCRRQNLRSHTMRLHLRPSRMSEESTSRSNPSIGSCCSCWTTP